MFVDGTDYQSLWFDEKTSDRIFVIDQQKLPFSFEVRALIYADDVVAAIRDMIVRGAPVIGAAAAWGVYLAACHGTPGKRYTQVVDIATALHAARPTAVNLKKGLANQMARIYAEMDEEKMLLQLKKGAQDFAARETDACKRIGIFGLPVLEKMATNKKGKPVNILTHCNAGWLACIDYGTALAPVYEAHNRGIPVHVYVDETRPRNQGGLLTIWELQKAGVPCTLISDNTGGHLMQHGMVDVVLVGSDRTTRNGDVANKIGTYLKALAAKDNGVPFYVALPTSSIDPEMVDGLKEIPVEQRSEEEVLTVRGFYHDGEETLRVAPPGTKALNYAFDITPASLVTGLITEQGIVHASEEGILPLLTSTPQQDE